MEPNLSIQVNIFEEINFFEFFVFLGMEKGFS